MARIIQTVPLEWPVHKKNTVLAAIKELGHTVSAADVAARTGLSLFDTRLTLNRIALETRAVLEVSARGDISYKFFPDLESIYKIVGIRKLLQGISRTVYEIGFFLIRVSFGLLLIASILTIAVVFAVALIFILFGVGAADSDGELGDMDAGLDFEFFDLDELPMFFAWSTLAGARTPTSDDEYMGVRIDTPDKGFFQNCFSFLFGEGNPNKNLEEKQWQLIAEQIRRSRGVITAEQIAPYSLRNRTDARSMLAIMVRFDGVPEVTPAGNIVYCFPSLQVTASGIKSMIQIPEYLEEQEWKFSKVPTERLHWVFFFAGANLCGAYALNKHLSWFQPLIPYADQVHLLMVYAAFFMGFPILRELANSVLNAFIERRNRLRKLAVAALASPEARFKINEAHTFAIKAFNLSAQPVFYSTERDILEQNTDGLAQKIDLMSNQSNVSVQIPHPSQNVSH